MVSVKTGIEKIWKPLAVCLAVVFAYAGVLQKLAGDWWADENYSHGLLIPFLIAYILWIEANALKKIASRPQWLAGGLIISISFAMLLGGTLGAELFMQRVSLVVLLAGLAAYFFGWRIIGGLFTPFLLLIFAIPIPQIIFNKIAFPLQIYASQMAVFGIRLLEVPSVRQGNVIEILPLGATQVVGLEVVEACSGIRSLMTLMTLGLVLAYFTAKQRTGAAAGGWAMLKGFDFWRTLILVFSAIPIAIFTNAARVTSTGVLTYYYGRQAADGFIHELSGWLVYVAALIILLALNWVLQRFASFSGTQQAKASEAARLISGERMRNASLYGLIGLLLLGGIFINWFERRGEVVLPRKELKEVPSAIGDWKQKLGEIKFSDETENVLKTTDYTMREYYLPNGRMANLYIGYYASQKTGATYHSPQNCLPGAGWEMRDPQLIEISQKDGRKFSANRYLIENGPYRHIMIYWYQGRGRIQSSEYADKVFTVWDSIWLSRSDGAMVRIITQINNDEREATEAAAGLASLVAGHLPEFVPE